MELIGMEKDGGTARIDFYGCPLSCEYCAFIDQERRDYDIMEVLEFLADPKVDRVFIAGAEPGFQKEELMELLHRLKRMKKRTILKTSGYYPDLLEETIGLVNQYFLEVKCPLDDPDCNQNLTGLEPEGAERYTEHLSRALEILKEQRLRVWIRVVPGYLDEEKMNRIGHRLQGIADEVLLLQFLSDGQNDIPFRGIDRPGPEEAEMVDLARQLVKYVPEVSISGEGFASEFRSH